MKKIFLILLLLAIVVTITILPFRASAEDAGVLHCNMNQAIENLDHQLLCDRKNFDDGSGEDRYWAEINRTNKERNTMTIKRLKKELGIAKQNQKKFIRRDGYQYGQNGYQFDAEIKARRAFAIEWREKALNLMENEGATHRFIHEDMWTSKNDLRLICRKFHVFSVAGRDVLMVCPSLPSTDDRQYANLNSDSAEQWISINK